MFNGVGWGMVIEPDEDAEGMEAMRIGEIGDGGTDNGFVGDIEVDIVGVAESSGAPIDLEDFGVLIFDDQPVAWLEGFSDFEGDTRDDIAEEILHGKADDPDDDGGTENHSLDILPIDGADDEDDRSDDGQNGEDLAKKLGGRLVPFLFVPEFPEVAFKDGDGEEGAKEDGCGAAEFEKFVAINELGIKDFERDPEGEDYAEALIKDAKFDAGVAFENFAEGDGENVNDRDGDQFFDDFGPGELSGEHGVDILGVRV